MTGGDDDAAPQVAYLERPLPVTQEVLNLFVSVRPTEVMRVAAPCEESKCKHFDGQDCRLAVRLVQILPAVVDALPQCHIRATCRWFRQEGKAACVRCPQVATVSYGDSATLNYVAGTGNQPSAAQT
jgi:hypothetical protein